MQYIYATIIKSDFMVIKGHHMLHLKYMFQLITFSERQQTTTWHHIEYIDKDIENINAMIQA